MRQKKQKTPLSGLYGLVGHVHELLPAGVITKLHVVNAQPRLDKQTRNKCKVIPHKNQQIWPSQNKHLFFRL